MCPALKGFAYTQMGQVALCIDVENKMLALGACAAPSPTAKGGVGHPLHPRHQRGFAPWTPKDAPYGAKALGSICNRAYVLA
jgi:hypothetical protein